MTPTAISHQIRLLEDLCGQRLFRRRPRPLALTSAGERLFPVLRNGLDAFAAAIASLARDAEQHALRVTTPNAFASHWLIPRLPQWRAAHPDVPLKVIGTDAVVDLRAGDADVAIRYARSMPSDFPGQEVMRDTFYPVCAPRLLSPAKTDPAGGGSAALPAHPLRVARALSGRAHLAALVRDGTLGRSFATADRAALGSELSRGAARRRRGHGRTRHRGVQRRSGRPGTRERRAGEGT